MSTGEIVHRGLRYELMPVSVFVLSTAERSRVTYFKSDRAYGRAAISQGDVGTRWKSTV